MRKWKTYRNADGSPILGEYSFMTEVDAWEEEAAETGYVEVVEETWLLLETRVVKLGDVEVECCICDEEFTLVEPEPSPHYCAAHVPDPIDVRLDLIGEHLRAMGDRMLLRRES